MYNYKQGQKSSEKEQKNEIDVGGKHEKGFSICTCLGYGAFHGGLWQRCQQAG